MSRSPLAALAALSLAAVACEQKAIDAPWLTYPGIDGHDRYLPLLGTSHDPNLQASVTCSSCHPGDTFTQPVCTGCHGQAATDGLHTLLATGQLLAGYAWTPPPSATVAWRAPSCLTCHPQGGIPNASHHGFFPVDDASAHSRAKLGTAAGSFCLACHADPLDKASLAKLNCVVCHQGAAVQAPLPGKHATLLTANAYPIQATPRDCLRCHDGGQVDRVAAHGSRPGPTGYGRAGPWDGDPVACGGPDQGACKHGIPPGGAPGSCNVSPPPRWCVDCFACHDARPPAYGGAGPGLASRPWAQDWKIPASTANQTAAAACRGCHGPQ